MEHVLLEWLPIPSRHSAYWKIICAPAASNRQPLQVRGSCQMSSCCCHGGVCGRPQHSKTAVQGCIVDCCAAAAHNIHSATASAAALRAVSRLTSVYYNGTPKWKSFTPSCQHRGQPHLSPLPDGQALLPAAPTGGGSTESSQHPTHAPMLPLCNPRQRACPAPGTSAAASPGCPLKKRPAIQEQGCAEKLTIVLDDAMATLDMCYCHCCFLQGRKGPLGDSHGQMSSLASASVLQAQICVQEEPTLRPNVCTDCRQNTIMVSTWQTPQ